MIQLKKHLNRKTNEGKGWVGNADEMLVEGLDHPVFHADPALRGKEGEVIVVACGKDHSLSLYLHNITNF